MPGYNTNIEVIDALCKYFSCTLEELLEFIPDDEIRTEGNLLKSRPSFSVK